MSPGRFFRYFLSVFLVAFLGCLTVGEVRADGVYANIGTAHSNDGSFDAVSWSQGYPITIDNFGNYIVPIQGTAGPYYWAYSNDKGGSWTEKVMTGIDAARPSVAYDPISDKLHVLNIMNGDVGYRRYKILRTKTNQIYNIVLDSDVSPMSLESVGTCTSQSYTYPILLWKNTGSKGTLVAFWGANKTCPGGTISEVRGSMRVLSNTATDGVQASWVALNGTSEPGNSVGVAGVGYNKLYSYNGTQSLFVSAMIKGGSGLQKDDIYYFDIDQNSTHGFRRLSWNAGSGNWSGSWTSRATFGGNVDDSKGYNLKHELASKPVFDSGNDRVYLGIARWLDNTNGDTQSLYYVDNTDSVVLAGNVYSAGGAHCIYPTFDIAYDSVAGKVYVFYNVSGAESVCGNVYYKTYDGSAFSAATPYYTVSGRSVDIPIVYQSRDNDRMILFYRLNNASTPASPPHEIHFGYVQLNSTVTPTATSISSPYTLTSYTDFNASCQTRTNTEATDTVGELSLLSSFRDDFMTASELIGGLWTSGTWGATSFAPTTDGNVVVYQSTDGAYILSTQTFLKKTLEFRAKFTAHNFQHIGYSDGTGFGRYAMFSTMSNGQLNARVEAGGGEINASLGSSYLGDFHLYRIEWGASDVKFYIDDQLVSTLNQSPGSVMSVIASNNTKTAGSNLTLDWVRILDFQTTGSFQTCNLSSGKANTSWGNLSFGVTTPASITITVKARSSEDMETWSSWSSDIVSGQSVSTSNGRYLQLLYSFGGTATSTPTLDNMSLAFVTDSTAPSISGVTVSPGSTGGTVGWSTGENSSSQVEYGVSTSYGSLSSVSDTSPRVSTHSVSLSGLLSCITYHYRVRSTDAAGNEAIGSDNTFTTTGCVGSSTIESQTANTITTVGGGTVDLLSAGTGISLNVPANFAASNADFQIKKLDKTSTLATTSTPATFSSVGNYIYDLKALTDATTTVSSFSNPISVSFTYVAGDLSGIDESSLVIYRWDGANWNALSGCSVNTASKTVTCQTSGFSVFGLFGKAASSTNSGSSSSGPVNTECNRLAPSGKVPWLYAALPEGKNSLRLYFTDASSQYDHYALEFGENPGVYSHGVENIGGVGTRTFRVDSLKTGEKYFFRVRAVNDCVPGEWSNVISASVKRMSFSISGVRNVFKAETKKVMGESVDVPTEKQDSVKEVAPTKVEVPVQTVKVETKAEPRSGWWTKVWQVLKATFNR